MDLYQSLLGEVIEFLPSSLDIEHSYESVWGQDIFLQNSDLNLNYS